MTHDDGETPRRRNYGSGAKWEPIVGYSRAVQRPDGKIVTITWQSGQAVLTRDGEASGHIVVHETGRPDLTFDVKRDNP